MFVKCICKLSTRKTELALEVKFHLDFHRVTRPWQRTLTNGSDFKYVFPRCQMIQIQRRSQPQNALFANDMVCCWLLAESPGSFCVRMACTSSVMFLKTSSAPPSTAGSSECSLTIWREEFFETRLLQELRGACRADGVSWLGRLGVSRLSHNYHVKSPKYLSGISCKEF